MNRRSRLRKVRSRVTLMLAGGIALLLTSNVAAAAGSAQFHWKPVQEAQLKIDDKPPLKWNVFQPDKKKLSNVVLILLGRRYIALDTKAKLAYLVFPADLRSQGQDFDSEDLRNSSRVIPSENWSVRDVGPATSIRLTLKDYGRTIDVELPHPIDFRAVY